MTEALTDDEIRLTKWIDGELGDGEVTDLLEANPDLFGARRAIEEIGDFVRLRGWLPGDPVEPPMPEVFNRQILRRIEEIPANQLDAAWRLFRDSFGDWWSDSQWALPMTAAAALTLGLVVVTGWESGRDFHSEIVHTYAPHPQHTVTSEFSKRAGAMVIEFEGLEAVPENSVITGYFQGQRKDGTALAADYRLGVPPVPAQVTSTVTMRLASSHPR